MLSHALGARCISTRPRTDYLFFIDWLSCPALIEIMVRATKALWVVTGPRDMLRDAR